MTVFGKACSLIARPFAPILYRLVSTLLNRVSDDRTYRYRGGEIQADPPPDWTEDELSSMITNQLAALLVLAPVMWIGAPLAVSAAFGPRAPLLSALFFIGVLVWGVVLVGLDGAPVTDFAGGSEQ